MGKPGLSRWRVLVWEAAWHLPFLPGRLRKKMFAQVGQGVQHGHG